MQKTEGSNSKSQIPIEDQRVRVVCRIRPYLNKEEDVLAAAGDTLPYKRYLKQNDSTTLVLNSGFDQKIFGKNPWQETISDLLLSV